MIPEIKTILYATDLSKIHLTPFFMLSIWQKDITQELLFYILLNLFVLCTLKECLIVFKRCWKKPKMQERETDLEEIKKYLQKFCQNIENQIKPSCVELVSKTLSRRPPRRRNFECSEEEGCDAIVLGTHGKGFLDTLFLGVWLKIYWKELENRFRLYRCHLKKPILIGITSDRFIYSIKQARIRTVLPCLCIFAPVIGTFYGYATVNICKECKENRGRPLYLQFP